MKVCLKIVLFFLAGIISLNVHAQKKSTNPLTKTDTVKHLFIDVHHFGKGKVTAKDVADAHQKDLAVQKKHGVNLINHWVDEKNGIVMCLAQAPNADSLINTHKEAHGLIPISVEKIKQGQ
jgi:hypothetical protein